MANYNELLDLHEKLLNRKCYTMANVIEESLTGKEGASSKELMKQFSVSPFISKAMENLACQLRGHSVRQRWALSIFNLLEFYDNQDSIFLEDPP